eukprot:175213-Pleurochrysis_carterae.AAC.1
MPARCLPTSRRMPQHIKLADGAPLKEEQEEATVVDAPVDIKVHRRCWSNQPWIVRFCRERENWADGVSYGLNEAQIEMLRGVQDPFHALRLVIFAIFAIVGLAGVVVSVSQLPSNPAEFGNVVVNGFVLAVGCAAFVFDQRVQSQLKQKLEDELANPYLKGGAGLERFFSCCVAS